MAKYRFKTEEEFRAEGRWRAVSPSMWNGKGNMNYLLGKPIDDKYNEYCDARRPFKMDEWHISNEDYVEINPEAVNHPKHYNNGKVETIDAIEAALGPEGFEGFLAGNCLKYISRYKHKSGTEDLRKAEWYLNKLLEFKDGK